MSSLCSFNHPITLSSKRGSSSSKINDGFFSRSLFSEVLIVLVLKLVIIKGKKGLRPVVLTALKKHYYYFFDHATLWSSSVGKKAKKIPPIQYTPKSTVCENSWKVSLSFLGLKSMDFCPLWVGEYRISGSPFFCCCFPGYISSNHQRNPQVTVYIIVFQSIFLALCC